MSDMIERPVLHGNPHMRFVKGNIRPTMPRRNSFAKRLAMVVGMCLCLHGMADSEAKFLVNGKYYGPDVCWNVTLMAGSAGSLFGDTLGPVRTFRYETVVTVDGFETLVIPGGTYSTDMSDSSYSVKIPLKDLDLLRPEACGMHYLTAFTRSYEGNSTVDIGYSLVTEDIVLTISMLEPLQLTASDGDYYDHVQVEWTGGTSDETYTLSRDGLTIAAAITGSSYSDTTAIPGTKYKYQIISSEDRISNEDEGYAMPKPPKLGALTVTHGEKIDANNYVTKKQSGSTEWFLVAGKAAQFDTEVLDYNKQYYRLKSSVLIGRHTGNVAVHEHIYYSNQLQDPAECASIVFAPTLQAGTGFHGEYTWYVKAVFVDIKNRESTATTPGAIEEPVFFDKGGKDQGSDPNWFTYWKEDGACPSLNGSDRKISISYELGESTWGGFSDKGGVQLSPVLAADMHYSKIFEVESPQIHKFSGPHIWGIYTVEEVVAHESSHAKLNDRYYAFCLWGNTFDSFVFDSDWHEPKPKWEANDVDIIVDGIGRCEHVEKEYCDHLFDSQEGLDFSEYELDKHKCDTYKIGKKKGYMSASKQESEYVAYGDDEFLAMIAANKATDEWRAEWKKDWAFPGEQSCVPIKVEEARNVDGWYEKRQGGLPHTKAQKQTSAAKREQAENGANDTNVGTPSVNVKGMTKEVEYDERTSLVSAVRYKLDMQVAGLQELRLTGIMTDSAGNAVAYANATVYNGNVIAELNFKGSEIYESRKDGPFRLDSVKLVEFSGIDFSELATLCEFKDGEVDLRRKDFVRNDAYLLDVASEKVTTNGIVVSVNVEVNIAGEYGITATLVNSNGVPVASCNVSASCTHGTNSLDVIWAANEIFESCIDGPYNIDNIALFKDGERVDSRLHFYSLCKKYQSQAFDFDEDASFDSSQFMAQFDDYTPPAELPPPERFWVFFNPNGGTISETMREVKDGDKIGTLPIPTLENDEFLGWYTELEGGTRITDSTIVTTNMMCHARWKNGGVPDPVPTQQAWTVTFNANGGTVSPATRQVAGGSAVGTLPTATRSGYTLVGWFTAASGGTQVSASTKVTANVTYYAHWAQNGGGDGPGGETGPSGAPTLFAAGHAETPFTGDATYNGWVRNKDGTIAGLLTVKAGKAAKPEKGGQSKLTVNYTPFGGRKQTIKLDNAAMPAAGGVAAVAIPGVGTVKFTGDAIVGVDVDVQAAKDALKSKDRAEKAAATAFAAGKAGTWTFALGTDAGYAAFTATVDKKGKGKLAGTLPDGTKVSVSAQGILGDGVLAIPFAYAKKGALGFVFWVRGDGTAELSDLTGALGNRALPEVSVVAPSAAHRLPDGEHTFTAGGISQGFAVAGKKWDVPRQNRKADPDPNPTGLKLAFTEKTGAVKGAFTVADGKAKTKYTVVGVVVGGKLYGAAYARNVGSMPATAE